MKTQTIFFFYFFCDLQMTIYFQLGMEQLSEFPQFRFSVIINSTGPPVQINPVSIGPVFFSFVISGLYGVK